MKRTSLILLSIIITACSSKGVEVILSNPIDVARVAESVEIPWAEVSNKITDADTSNIIVRNINGEQITSQILTDATGTPSAILFQADIEPSSQAAYFIRKGLRYNYESMVYGRSVPERKDDFAWENNRIAYRMYGPALEATGEISSGIDVWLKKTEEMVINKWYTPGYDYHTDSGEGVDCYKVGPSLGAGSLSPIVCDTIIFSNNYTSYKILENGPLRIKFELNYAPMDVNGTSVSQRRIISLDANSNLNKITSIFNSDIPQIDAVSGIVLRNEDQKVIDTTQNSIAYTEPEDKINGTTYIAVITPDKSHAIVKNNHILKPTVIESGKPYTYYTGGYWSKSGVKNLDAWRKIVISENQKIENPIIVTCK